MASRDNRILPRRGIVKARRGEANIDCLELNDSMGCIFCFMNMVDFAMKLGMPAFYRSKRLAQSLGTTSMGVNVIQCSFNKHF